MSRKFKDSEETLKFTLIGVAIGGFTLILVLSQLFNPQLIVGIGGRIWFSLCAVLATIYTSVCWFNPDRDSNHRTFQESWCVFILNMWLVFAVLAWFME